MLRVFVAVAVVTLAGCPSPDVPPGAPCTVSARPPEPTRVVLDDCSSLVDVAALPPVLPAPDCPAPQPPVTSLCPGGRAGPAGVVQSQVELEAWRGCTVIEGDLTIGGTVCSLLPLGSLEEVAGRLTLGGGEGSAAFAIVDLDGLGALRSVGRDLSISGLPALASLRGLDALEHVGFDFDLRQLPALVHLTGPDTLRDVGGDINVSFNPALVLVDGFAGLLAVGTDTDFRTVSGLRFGHDDELRCIDGFAALAELVEVELENLPLEAAPGLAAVLVARAPTLKLIDLPSFNLLSLPRLESLAGLDLVRPPPVRDLRAFSGLTTLGPVSIFGSTLESLGGLEGVVSLSGLALQQNPDLADLSALAHVEELHQLRITGDVTWDLACAFPAASHIDEVFFDRTSLAVIPWPASLQSIDTLGIAGNEALVDLGDPAAASFTLGDALIIDNPRLGDDDVLAWLDGLTVSGVAKYGNNADGPVDPCPWIDDGVCDFFCVADSAADCPGIED